MLCRCSSHSSIAFSSSSCVFIVECFARVRSCSRCNRSVNLIRMRNISEVRPSVYIEHCEACTESGWQNWDPGGCICGGRIRMGVLDNLKSVGCSEFCRPGGVGRDLVHAVASLAMGFGSEPVCHWGRHDSVETSQHVKKGKDPYPKTKNNPTD